MKYETGGDSEVLGMPVESLLLNSCWNTDHFIDSNSKILLGEDSEEENESKTGIDDLEQLLLRTESNQHNNNNNNNNNNNHLAELKPLPPFTGYTGHLSINGISGHHYHTIAAPNSGPRVGAETNNNSAETTNQNTIYYDQVVSSSTMDCNMDAIKTENVISDYNNLLNTPDIEDIAAIIGSAIAADTTVNGSNGGGGDNSRDSWMDLDAWIEGACETSAAASTSKNGGMSVLTSAESLQEFVANAHFIPPQTGASHASQQQVSPIITFPNIKRENASSSFPQMSLLASRLQNGPPKTEITYNLVSDCTSPSSSTHYNAHSPPAHVVSTTDLVRSTYNQVHGSRRTSPELHGGYPATTTTPSNKKPRNRNSKKQSMAAANSVVYSESSLGGKEKPVHRCNICNRGFLNKSNIKVHLRTHTGEKPFRCDVCGKAFRQKAHLIKHAQIHKRIGRD